MDREKVIKEYEDYVNSYISLTTSHDYEFEMHKAVLALLKEQEEEIENLKQTAQSMMEGICLMKEQEAVEPIVTTVEQRCGNCRKVIEMDGWIVCPWCGTPINWRVFWESSCKLASVLKRSVKWE